MYGLKQPPRMWYTKFHTYILGLGFSRTKTVDHCVYSKKDDDHFLYVILYVDDILLTRNNKDIKSQLYSKFDMKYLDATNFILDIEIKRDHVNKRHLLSQRKH